jgi:hypothetical protein
MPKISQIRLKNRREYQMVVSMDVQIAFQGYRINLASVDRHGGPRCLNFGLAQLDFAISGLIREPAFRDSVALSI